MKEICYNDGCGKPAKHFFRLADGSCLLMCKECGDPISLRRKYATKMTKEEFEVFKVMEF